MKTKITVILMLLFAQTSVAQTWGEWFNQKSTQKRYLIEQIAAYKMYLEFLKKGYGVVKDGTGLIGDIKNGDFSLHKDYFGSLKAVNPAIKRQDKVAYMLVLQSEMSLLRQEVLGEINNSQQGSVPERELMRKRLTDMGAEAAKDIEELSLVITDGQLELSDDERIARIDKLYKSMVSKYAYHKRLCPAIISMLKARQQGRRDTEDLRSLYGY